MVATTTDNKAKHRLASVSTLKKKVRDRQRLLSRKTSLPANALADQERALNAYKHELGTATQNRKEQALAKKYHMVRFFERQKASRIVKRLQKAAAEKPDDEAVAKELFDAEVTLNYTLHYPKDEKYISLFKDPGACEKVVEKRDAIKAAIAEQMRAGTLAQAVVLEKAPREERVEVVKKAKTVKAAKKEVVREKEREVEMETVHPSRRAVELPEGNRRTRRKAKALAKAEKTEVKKVERIEEDGFFEF